MELAQHLCVNLRKQYPNDSFLAYLGASTTAFGTGLNKHNIIFDMNNVLVSRLALSDANTIGDSALKSLLHRVVFESKSMSDNMPRAKYLYDEVKKMLPDYYITVFVTDVISNDRPVLDGPHKGLTYFWEPEFGDHVTVVIH